MNEKSKKNMIKLTKLLSIVMVFVVSVSSLIAQDEAQKDKADKGEAKVEEKKSGWLPRSIQITEDGDDSVYLKIGGYVDTYYFYNLNSGAESPIPTPIPNRVLSPKHHAFSLGLIQTKFNVGNDNWEVVADLVHGPNAEIGNFGNVSGSDSITSSAIKQAYASVSIADVKLTAGQFNTHIGYEVIEAYLNGNYSNSTLFDYGPFYHVGAKIDYELTEGLGAMVGIANGWDAADNTDNNLAKSIMAQLSFGMVSDLDLYINYMGGEESPAPSGWRNIFDLTLTYGLSSFLGLGFNGVFGNDALSEGAESKSWFGAAVYLDFMLNDQEEKYTYKLTVRGEYFDDSNAIRGFETSNMEITVTGTIGLYHGSFFIKPEYRFDMADAPIYSGDSKDQHVFGISMMGVY